MALPTASARAAGLRPEPASPSQQSSIPNADRREEIQQAYIRVCRDSGFQLDWARAAHFTATLLGISALEIWLQMPSLTVMMNIATGEHPAAHRSAAQPKEINP